MTTPTSEHISTSTTTPRSPPTPSASSHIGSSSGTSNILSPSSIHSSGGSAIDSPHSPSEAPTKTTSTLELEAITLHLYNLVATSQFSHPDFERYIVPDFTAHVEHSTQPDVTSREQLMTRYREVIEGTPNYRTEIQSIAADVDEEKGTAMVWMKLRVTAQEVQRQSVTVTYWERVKGCWRCLMQDGIRGMGDDE